MLRKKGGGEQAEMEEEEKNVSAGTHLREKKSAQSRSEGKMIGVEKKRMPFAKRGKEGPGGANRVEEEAGCEKNDLSRGKSLMRREGERVFLRGGKGRGCAGRGLLC